MSDAGKTCVALMVSAAKAGAPRTQASAAQIPLSILSLPLAEFAGASYHRPVTRLPATVFSAFEQTASAHPRLPFLLAYPQRIELTYGSALERIASIAARYRARGYGKGHRVGLRLPNCPEFLLHFL